MPESFANYFYPHEVWSACILIVSKTSAHETKDCFKPAQDGKPETYSYTPYEYNTLFKSIHGSIKLLKEYELRFSYYYTGHKVLPYKSIPLCQKFYCFNDFWATVPPNHTLR